MIYEIFETNLEALLVHIQKLNAKLGRLGATPATIKIVSVRDVPRAGAVNIVDRIVAVDVAAPAPATNGWSFIAKIIHTEDGNIINQVPGSGEVPPAYREGKPVCEHCNVNRFRRDTYVVRKGADTRQVGSSCLEEFLGTKNPQTLCAAMEVVVEIHGACDNAVRVGRPLDRTVDRFSVSRFLGYVAELVIIEGRFVTRKEGGNGATAIRARDMLYWVVDKDGASVPHPVRPEAVALAEAARDFVINKFAPPMPDLSVGGVDVKAIIMDHFSVQPNLTDFEHNLYTIVRSESIEARLCGIAAYVIEYYRRATGPAPRAVTQLNTDGLAHIFGMFTEAAKMLKRPVIRLADENVRLHLSLAGAASKNAGCIYVKADAGFEAAYYGKITKDGKWLGVRDCPPQVEPLLLAFAASPEEIAKKYGKLTGCCSFCGRKLTDDRSIDAGYGPVCAGKFGLNWGSRKVAPVAQAA